MNYQEHKEELVEKINMRGNAVKQSSTYQRRLNLGEIVLLSYPNKLTKSQLRKVTKLVTKHNNQVPLRKAIRAVGLPRKEFKYKNQDYFGTKVGGTRVITI